MRLNVLILAKKIPLIVKRRLKRPELSTTRLYLNQLNSILDNNKTETTDLLIVNEEPKSIINYIDRLFRIYKKSVTLNGIELDLILETWRVYFGSSKVKEIH